jgi:hypothetical protein
MIKIATNDSIRVEKYKLDFLLNFLISVRIEQTAKGARITVSALANNQEEAINQAIQMYSEAKRGLEAEGHKIAPIETVTDTSEDLKLRVIK